MSADPPTRATRVTMLLRNPYTHDTRVEKEARSLVAAGYAVTVVADGAAGLPARETKDGVVVLRVPRIGRQLPVLRYLRHRRNLLRAVEATRPDVIHAHDSETLEPVARLAAKLRVPFVYDAHDLWLGRIFRDRSALNLALFRAYYRWVERTFLPRAAGWVTVSAPIARHLEREYGMGPVQVVPNVPERPTGPVEPRDLRTLPGAERVPAGAPIVLYLGRVISGRGTDQLLAALPMVPDAHLVFLGGGAHAPVLEAEAERLGVRDRLHILPLVPPDEVIPYAASATVGVSAAIPTCLNYVYSLPNKLFQPMAAGLPVVASNFPQVVEVVAETGAGITVDMTDPPKIASALREVLADPERARRMGEEARRAIERQWNWDVAGGVLVDLYRRIRPPGAVSRPDDSVPVAASAAQSASSAE